MPHSYQILGSDGQVYGPVSAEDLQSWVREGRVAGSTQVHRSDQTAWQPASAFSELGLAPSAEAAPNAAAPATTPAARSPTFAPPTPADTVALEPLVAQIKSGAGWFYWIAALSLVNTVASLSGSNWGFIIGLGITQVFDAVAGAAGGSGKLIAMILDVLVLGVFVFFGYFAGQRRNWAFLVGMILYSFDGLIFVLVRDWPAAAFHVLALYFMFKGFQACRAYARLAKT